MAIFPPPGLGRPGPPAPPVVSPPAGPSPAMAGPPEGLKAQARVKLGNAVRELVEALGMLKEVASEEGKAIVSALKILAPVTPEVDQGLSRAQVLSALAGASAVRPGLGGAPPPMLNTPRPTPSPLMGPPLGAPMMERR